MFVNLYDLFISKDATMVEINPFAEDSQGKCEPDTPKFPTKKNQQMFLFNAFADFCLDAKLRFDDNADFRQKAVFDQRDWTQEDPAEVEAAGYNLVNSERSISVMLLRFCLGI